MQDVNIVSQLCSLVPALWVQSSAFCTFDAIGSRKWRRRCRRENGGKVEGEKLICEGFFFLVCRCGFCMLRRPTALGGLYVIWCVMQLWLLSHLVCADFIFVYVRVVFACVSSAYPERKKLQLGYRPRGIRESRLPLVDDCVLR